MSPCTCSGYSDHSYARAVFFFLLLFARATAAVAVSVSRRLARCGRSPGGTFHAMSRAFLNLGDAFRLNCWVASRVFPLAQIESYLRCSSRSMSHLPCMWCGAPAESKSSTCSNNSMLMLLERRREHSTMSGSFHGHGRSCFWQSHVLHVADDDVAHARWFAFPRTSCLTWRRFWTRVSVKCRWNPCARQRNSHLRLRDAIFAVFGTIS